MLVTTAVFCGTIALTHLLPLHEDDARAFLTPADGCAMPCWAGIRPGVTRLDEAVAILRAHPWVGHISMEGELASGTTSALIWWQWNGQQSDSIDERVDGRLIAENAVVKFVILSTRVSMGDARLALGPPPRGRLSMDTTALIATRFSHMAAYDGLTLQTPSPCPVRLTQLWQMPTQVYLYAAWPGMEFSPYALADWIANPPC